MYTHPEFSRINAELRSQAIQAKAEAYRQIAEARAARRADRPRRVWLHWPARTRSARRSAVAYSSTPNAPDRRAGQFAATGQSHK
jgi:hypothetical protein